MSVTQTRQFRPAKLRGLEAQRGQKLLRLADEEGIDERGQRLGVRRHRPAGQHQGIGFGACDRPQGEAAQIKNVEHAREIQLVLQGKADHVEIAKPAPGFQREERERAAAQFLFHVGPGREDALARDPWGLVQKSVQDLGSKM